MDVTLEKDGISFVMEFVDKVKAIPPTRYLITKDGFYTLEGELIRFEITEDSFVAVCT